MIQILQNSNIGYLEKKLNELKKDYVITILFVTSNVVHTDYDRIVLTYTVQCDKHKDNEVFKKFYFHTERCYKKLII